MHLSIVMMREWSLRCEACGCHGGVHAPISRPGPGSLNPQLGEPIARGATAEVYAWEPGWILKLFYPSFAERVVRFEARKAEAAHRVGVPTAAVGGQVRVGDRHGLLFERLDGPPLTPTLLGGQAAMEEGARTLAALQVRLHDEVLADHAHAFPPFKQMVAERIKETGALDDDLRRLVLETLDELPDGDAICHGDLHPDNVIVTADGPRIIDWTDASRGDPMADVAHSVLLLTAVTIPPHIPGREAIEVSRHAFNEVYLDHYLRSRPGSLAEVQRWMPVCAALRLTLGAALEREAMLAIVRRLA